MLLSLLSYSSGSPCYSSRSSSNSLSFSPCLSTPLIGLLMNVSLHAGVQLRVKWCGCTGHVTSWAPASSLADTAALAPHHPPPHRDAVDASRRQQRTRAMFYSCVACFWNSRRAQDRWQQCLRLSCHGHQSPERVYYSPMSHTALTIHRLTEDRSWTHSRQGGCVSAHGRQWSHTVSV